MEKTAVIDRIVDGSKAVLLVGEEEDELVVAVDELPPQAKAGQWLRVRLEGDRLVAAAIDQAETAQVEARIDDKLARLRQRGRRG